MRFSLLFLLSLSLLSTSCLHSLKKRARAGEPAAQYEYGHRLLTGRGCFSNPEEAVAWMRVAAEQNHPSAQAALGLCYQKGIGTAANLTEASHWYKKAADHGHVFAMLSLANIAEQAGKSAERKHWYTRAAATGVPYANFVCLSSEKLSKKQREQCIDRIRYAAIQGSPDAACYMAVLHHEGIGRTPNPQLAAGWLKFALERGDLPAPEKLKMHEN